METKRRSVEGKVDWDNGMIVPNSRDIGLSNGADRLSMQRITLINCSKTTRQRKKWICAENVPMYTTSPYFINVSNALISEHQLELVCRLCPILPEKIIASR